MLVCMRLIQTTEAPVIWAQFDVVKPGQHGIKGCDLIAARVQAGLEAMPTDPAQRCQQLIRVLPFSQKADAGDQTFVALNERIQITLQRFTCVLA